MTAEVIRFAPPQKAMTPRPQRPHGLNRTQFLEAAYLLRDFAAQMGLCVTVHDPEKGDET